MFKELCWDFCHDAYRTVDGTFVDELPISVDMAKGWIESNKIAHNTCCQDPYPIEDLLQTATNVTAHIYKGIVIGCSIECDKGLFVLNTPEYDIDWEEYSCEWC